MYVFQENLSEINEKCMDCIIYIYNGLQSVHGMNIMNTNTYQEHILLYLVLLLSSLIQWFTYNTRWRVFLHA